MPGRRRSWDSEIDRRRFVQLVSGAALVGGSGVLSGCLGDSGSPEVQGSGAPGRPGGTLAFSLTGGSTNETLDPAKTVSVAESILSGSLYEGLVRLHHGRRWVVEPLLATRWSPNADLTEWRFELRDDARFHSGAKVTSADVVYTLRRVLDPEVGSHVAARLSSVMEPEGVTAAGPYDVRVRLRRPDAFFPLVMGARHTKIVPEGAEDFSESQASGAFRLERFEPGQGFELSKNKRYWNRNAPKLDGIRCTYVSEQATLTQGVLSGEADFAGIIEYSTVPTIKGRSEAALMANQASGLLVANADSRRAPWNDPRVMKALKLALDRDRVRQVAHQGYGVLTSDVPVSSKDEFYPPSLGIREQQISEAKQLLTDAGHPNGLETTLFTGNASPGLVDMATVIAEQAREAGIRINVEQRPGDTYFDRVWTKVPFFMDSWVLRHPFEAISVIFHSKSDVNTAHYKNPELDALLDKAQSSAKLENQKAALRQAQLLIAEEATWLCPTFGAWLYLRKPNVGGVAFNATDLLNFEQATVA